MPQLPVDYFKERRNEMSTLLKKYQNSTRKSIDRLIEVVSNDQPESLVISARFELEQNIQRMLEIVRRGG